MKVYSIGRDLACDIIIDDNTDVISRRHATLNVESSGKMTIVDLSHNGTYVNGIRINQNVPVPVTRNDTVSFAHVAQLDWNQIPNTPGVIIRYVLIALLAVLLIGGAIWGYTSFMSKPVSAPDPTPVTVDSAALKKEEQKMKEDEKARMDSIKKHVQDSLNKVRAQKKASVKAKGDAKKPRAKNPEKGKKEEEKPTRFH